MRKGLVATTLAIFLCQSSNAAVTALFNNAFNGGVPSNLASSSGVVTNGLVYGILVDTGSNGFDLAYDSGFTLSQGAVISLTVNGVASDDKIFIAAVAGMNQNDYLTYDTSGDQEGDFITTGGNGGVGGISGIDSSLAERAFGLIWFDASQAVGANVDDGTQFGFLRDAGTYTLPTDGNPGTYDVPFVGNDPVRSATDGIFQAIPEPSTAILAMLGALGIFRRRR